MPKIRLITRADDAGSSRAANGAVLQAAGVGFMKNVSLMAVGAYINEAAETLKNKNVCFGMHATLNAEWDRIKWGPLTNMNRESGLVDENGFFLPYPALFHETRPAVETIIAEYDAQLEKLFAVGFDIAYVDSHMGEERLVEGLLEAKREWAYKKGLIFHGDVKLNESAFKDEWNSEEIFNHAVSLREGQYLYVTHPALYCEEMLLTGTKKTSGEDIARTRDRQAKIISDRNLFTKFNEAGVETIRYDEAETV